MILSLNLVFEEAPYHDYHNSLVEFIVVMIFVKGSQNSECFAWATKISYTYFQNYLDSLGIEHL